MADTPPNLKKRKLTEAASMTMATRSSGRANSSWYCNRYPAAARPACSAVSMYDGSSQNDTVSGVAKLSRTCSRVRLVLSE